MATVSCAPIEVITDAIRAGVGELPPLAFRSLARRLLHGLNESATVRASTRGTTGTTTAGHGGA